MARQQRIAARRRAIINSSDNILSTKTPGGKQARRA